MVLLCCATVGAVECVVVEIGLEEFVFTLKTKIQELLGYPRLAKDLELYLALANGQWLGAEAVEKGELTETINELVQRDKRLMSGVSVGKYFVGQTKPAITVGQVHILAVAPKLDAAGSMQVVKRDLVQLKDTIARVVEGVLKTDRTSWSCSKVSTDRIKQIGYEPQYVPWPTMDDVLLERDYPEFKSTDGKSKNHRTQMELYKEYFGAVLEVTKHLWIKTDLELDVPVGKDQHLQKGRAVLYLVPNESFTCNEIAMVIEVRPGSREETLSEAQHAQTMGYCLAANAHFSRGDDRPSPVGLLTNLNDAWCFFWVNPKGKICYASTKKNGQPLDRKTALYYMRKHCDHVNSCIEDLSSSNDISQDRHVVFGTIPSGLLEK
ncbi:unnamed protein product [Aphanomyces euteiches]